MNFVTPGNQLMNGHIVVHVHVRIITPLREIDANEIRLCGFDIKSESERSFLPEIKEAKVLVL